MKNLKFLYLGLLCATLVLFNSCKSDDEDTTPEIVDIVATAQATDDLSMLVEAVVKTDLTATLQGDGPFTVLAPNNAAFQTLLNDNADWNSIDDIPTAALKDILLFHVIGANVKAADLTDSYVTTANTAAPNEEQVALQIDVTGGVVFNGSSNPITTDVEATNGTVHIINKVMSPPNVVDFALNNPAFSSLVAALTRSDNMTNFVEVLSGEGPFTVFAPTNAAFDALLAGNADWNTLADIPVGTLDAVLKYHVVGANAQSDELTNGQELSTLNGDLITVSTTDGVSLSTTSGQSAVGVAIPDVQGTNGVVHAVSSVLVPQL